MQRPVWLLSLDSEGFHAVPMTTGGLAAYFMKYGSSASRSDCRVVHFADEDAVRAWLAGEWLSSEAEVARQAARQGLGPVLGLSVYTWNAAIFLELLGELRQSCPELLVVAGGPHVQAAEPYLRDDGIDVVVLGEGEVTFQQLLDAPGREAWPEIAGLAYLDASGALVQTTPRSRRTELDSLPSALDVVALRGSNGEPLYPSAAYETTRGCPFKCAFCEWGTGAIGTKMIQLGMARIRSDLERLVAGGIKDLWLCDSNFGALREDLHKARLVVELHRETGLPATFATSWSKNHNARVQEIVRMLAREGLITHYNLALQTLTPEALALANRKNMRLNQYQPIALGMASEGIPIATELIWGLPGDTLEKFEENLDRLITIFPNVNIFGYTLLPGTEFYERREELRLETVPVAGYGKAKGEYVIGCISFDREQGLEGYFLITAHILLIRGHIMPLTARLLALDGSVPVSSYLRAVLRALLASIEEPLRVEQAGGAVLDLDDRIAIYERRSAVYLALLADLPKSFAVIADATERWLSEHGAPPELSRRARQVLELDRAICPRVGKARVLRRRFDFDARAVLSALGAMERPAPSAFGAEAIELDVDHPAHVGEVLDNPDGGSWMKGRVLPAAVDGAVGAAAW